MGNKSVNYKHNTSSFQDYLNKKFNNQFELIGEYLSQCDTINLKCLHCGNEFNCNRNTLYNQNNAEKCPECRKIKARQNIKEQVEKRYLNIKVLSIIDKNKYNYIVKCSCLNHNNIFMVNSSNALSKNKINHICPMCNEEIGLQRRINNLKSKFPISSANGLTLNFYDYLQSKRKIFVDCVDQYGYKYRIDSERISVFQNIDCKLGLNRFFKHNPYTRENINNFFRLNNIGLKLIDEINYHKGANINYHFMWDNGEILNTNWNTIQTNPTSFNRDNQNEKIYHIHKTRMTKERAIEIIKSKEQKLQRPLLQTDFENTKTTDDTIGIRIIWKYWGTFRNMIKELGLQEHDTYYKPNNVNYKNHTEIMDLINQVCNKVKNENRSIITTMDFKSVTDIDISTLKRHCQLDNTTLKDVLEQNGCKMQQAGNGMNYTFDDGELTVSKYEYDFSKFLRKNGFVYNTDYFRDVLYKTLDNDYNGKMNCDYCIIINGNPVYVELAGILGNDEHIKAYKDNIPIKSKSKETYRLKLNQKREIFEKNKLNYYILLKDDMNENTYKNIIEKYSTEVA